MGARRWPAREEHLLTVHYCKSSKSLEGDHSKDRVRLCRLSKSFQEGPHQKLFNLKTTRKQRRARLDDKIYGMSSLAF